MKSPGKKSESEQALSLIQASLLIQSFKLHTHRPTHSRRTLCLLYGSRVRTRHLSGKQYVLSSEGHEANHCLLEGRNFLVHVIWVSEFEGRRGDRPVRVNQGSLPVGRSEEDEPDCVR